MPFWEREAWRLQARDGFRTNPHSGVSPGEQATPGATVQVNDGDW